MTREEIATADFRAGLLHEYATVMRVVAALDGGPTPHLIDMARVTNWLCDEASSEELRAFHQALTEFVAKLPK
jgi:hypothetical protein